MTFNPADQDSHRLDPLLTRGKVGFADLSPNLKLILICLFLGLIVSLWPTESWVFLENDIVKSGIVLLSAVMASAAFYFAYRSAQRTKKREVMRAQADELLSSLQNLKSRISSQ
jgi:hypothetical protein